MDCALFILSEGDRAGDHKKKAPKLYLVSELRYSYFEIASEGASFRTAGLLVAVCLTVPGGKVFTIVRTLSSPGRCVITITSPFLSPRTYSSLIFFFDLLTLFPPVYLIAGLVLGSLPQGRIDKWLYHLLRQCRNVA